MESIIYTHDLHCIIAIPWSTYLSRMMFAYGKVHFALMWVYFRNIVENITQVGFNLGHE